jgi:hypothetical protein
MDDTTRSIIRNVKGPGTIFSPLQFSPLSNLRTACFSSITREFEMPFARKQANKPFTVRENDILCLLESEREARRLR